MTFAIGLESTQSGLKLRIKTWVAFGYWQCKYRHATSEEGKLAIDEREWG